MEFPTQFSDYGRGAFVRNLPETREKAYRDFSLGLVLRGARDLVPENATPRALDTFVDPKGRIVRTPGTTLMTNFTDRLPTRMAVHASLDFTAELVLFDPPYLIVKKDTASTEIADKELHAGDLAWTNFGGTLVFTDGNRVWARQSNEGTTIAEIDEAPVARTYAAWAGRLWSGMPVIDGRFEPHGLAWSAANSDYRDWTGIGAGNELLINDLLMGDQIQSLVPMGLDFMAIFLRNSIWVASRTGLVDRPGDFRVRQPRTGAVNRRVCQATRFGVLYLNEDGVHLFNGNNSEHVSAAIDGELLPLDYANLESYSASFDPRTEMYYLHTPTDTWVLDLELGRWHRRSLSVYASAIWYDQIAAITWGELQGDWAAQAPFVWHDYAGQSDTIQLVMLGDAAGVARTLHKEDPESFQYFGEVVEPEWELPSIHDMELDNMLLMDRATLKYSGGGDFTMQAVDQNNKLVDMFSETLPGTNAPTIITRRKKQLCLPTGLSLKWGATSRVRVSSAELAYQVAGKRVMDQYLTLDEVLISQFISSDVSNYIGDGTLSGFGQVFLTPAEASFLTKMGFVVMNTEAAVGRVVARLYSLGMDDLPDVLLAESVPTRVDDWDGSATVRYAEFDRRDPVELTAATLYYAVIFEYDLTGRILVGQGQWVGTPHANGQARFVTGGGWQENVGDNEVGHEVYSGTWS